MFFNHLPLFFTSSLTTQITLLLTVLNMMRFLCLVITLAVVASAVPVSNSTRAVVTKRQQAACVFMPPPDECEAGYVNRLFTTMYTGICQENID
ncbi:uncharacterized protein BDV14DRAFT_162472 [Aspergillus stella-maris]|uniref:uncharacterized protein n=1 Tax=Aspergillus stella-maris TaxID=1810926 RepID=UPI003CCD7332